MSCSLSMTRYQDVESPSRQTKHQRQASHATSGWEQDQGDVEVVLKRPELRRSDAAFTGLAYRYCGRAYLKQNSESLGIGRMCHDRLVDVGFGFRRLKVTVGDSDPFVSFQLLLALMCPVRCEASWSWTLSFLRRKLRCRFFACLCFGWIAQTVLGEYDLMTVLGLLGMASCRLSWQRLANGYDVLKRNLNDPSWRF